MKGEKSLSLLTPNENKNEKVIDVS
jgi:hypothetical protein